MPVSNTVADGADGEPVLCVGPGAGLGDGGRLVGDTRRGAAARDRHRPAPVGGPEPGTASDAVELAADPTRKRAAADPEDLELAARGAGVPDEEGIHQAGSAAAAPRSAAARRALA